MKLGIYAGLLALAVTPAWAGKRILMEETDLATGKVMKQEILIDNTRLKSPSGDRVVMFLTDGGNRMVQLDKARNEYRVIDQAMVDSMAGQAAAVAPQMAQMQAQMAAAMKNMTPEQQAQMAAVMKGRGMPGAPAAAAAPAPITYAAKGAGNANGFKCTNYEGTRSGEKVTEICAATAADAHLAGNEYQISEKMREFTAKLTQMAPQAQSSGITEAGVNGLPVQTIHYVNGKATSRMDVKSVTDATFTDADFSTGSAKQMEMPGIGGRGRGKGK